MFVKFAVVLPVVLAMIVLRFFRPNMLVWGLGWILGTYVVLRFGMQTPIPVSVVNIYMFIALLGLFAYITSSKQRIESSFGPVVRLVTEPRHRIPLVLVVLLIPSLVAASIYMQMNVPLEAPAFPRTIHPAPPDSITVRGNAVDLITAQNPFRALETSDPEEFKRRVENGRDTYYENCHYCHGDEMTGKGMFAHALNPIPTNFADPGTIAMLQESFLFWRIAKGAPGLPDEGGPWDSAMPAWEQFLTEDEMWEVVLFLYEFTDQRPRANVEHH